MPTGWEDKRKKPKMWSDGARTDDPTKRQVLPPIARGIGDGKSFSFLFGLKIHSQNDRMLFDKARAHIDDDVEVLRRAGYTVVVDEQSTHKEFVDAVYGRGEGVEGLVPAGIFVLAHGHADGAIETCDGGCVRPDDVDPEQVHPGLRLAVFAACYVGSMSRTWRKRFADRPLVVGWGRPVTIDRAVEFLTPDPATETDLDDLVRRYMLIDTPIPAVVDHARWSPLGEAASAGRTGDLPQRIDSIVAMLRAKHEVQPNAIVVDVPLEANRYHRAKMFVVDGTDAFVEGEPMLGVEADVGEISHVVDPAMLLSGIEGQPFARVALVKGQTEMPRIVVQGFLPLARIRDQDLAALTYQVCRYADTLERRIFGGDAG